MKYRIIPGTDLKVSELCLGGNIFGHFCNFEETKKIIDFAYNQGINFIDTANVYSDGLSEEYIGKSIKGRREKFIIATKAGVRPNQKPKNVFTKEYIIKSVNESLNRLQTDYIDLYQVHHFDLEIPIKETLKALNELIRTGKVRYIGCSNYNLKQIVEALNEKEKKNFSSIQLPYNLLNQEIEKEVIPFCNQLNIGILPYQVLDRGLLTGKYNKIINIPTSFRGSKSEKIRLELTPKKLKILKYLEEYTKRKTISLTELSLAWVLRKKEVCSVIIGVRNIDQLKECINSIKLNLSIKDLKEIENIIMGLPLVVFSKD